jgi:endonuclease/exonuclease/phosphatase family metal-dependent hydrolase
LGNTRATVPFSNDINKTMANLCLAVGLTGMLRVLGFFTEPLLGSEEIHRIAGEPFRIERRAAPAEDLKVITWNIEQGAAYDSVLAVLRSVNADILLLQEVDRGCRRTGYRDVPRDLAHALDMNWVAAGEFQEIGEARGARPAITGQAILSRFPIEGAAALRFAEQDRWRWSVNPVQPRRGGRMALKARTAGMLLYNTHIESGDNEKLKRGQIAEILADQSREVGRRAQVLVGGDFNNGPILRSAMFGYFTTAAFEDALGSPEHRIATSRGQLHPIDWIFVKNVTPIRGRVIDAQSASDHSPVFASLAAIATPAIGR